MYIFFCYCFALHASRCLEANHKHWSKAQEGMKKVCPFSGPVAASAGHCSAGRPKASGHVPHDVAKSLNARHPALAPSVLLKLDV